jgi:hypothetical protein
VSQQTLEPLFVEDLSAIAREKERNRGLYALSIGSTTVVLQEILCGPHFYVRTFLITIAAMTGGGGHVACRSTHSRGNRLQCNNKPGLGECWSLERRSGESFLREFPLDLGE